MAVLKNGKFPTLLFWVKYKLGLAREGVDFVAVPIPKVKALVDALECPQNEVPWCKDCPYAVWGFQGQPDRLDHCDDDRIHADAALLIRLTAEIKK